MKTVFALVVSASAVAAGVSFASTPAATDVFVTRDSLSLPMGCSPREVAAFLNGFFDAFNRGDMQALVEIWTKEDSPGPRSVREDASSSGTRSPRAARIRTGPWRERSIYDRPELLGYFAERHRQNERMSLVAVRVVRARAPWAAGNQFVVRRSADDLPAGLGGRQRVAGGKGQIDCERHRLQLWTMFMNMADVGRDYPPSGAGVPCHARQAGRPRSRSSSARPERTPRRSRTSSA
jgi:hypothetical protein